MARMYSRKKGRSGSKKPLKKSSSWVKLKPQEVEEIVIKQARKGESSARIGTILRDEYGVPSAKLVAKSKVTTIMKKHNVYPKFPEDLFNLMKMAVSLQAHLGKNKKDYTSKRGLELTESKIRRLAKFYKRKKALPQDWKWDIGKAKLWVK